MRSFGSYHPIFLFVYFVSVLMITMFVFNPVIQLTALIGAFLFAVLPGNNTGLKSSMGFYAAMFLLISITNPLFSHNGQTPLFYMNGNAVTLEAFFYGAEAALAVTAVLLWFRAFTDVFTSDKFMYLFGRAVPSLSLILSMSLRFVPLYMRQFKRSVRVMRAMGMYNDNGILNKAKSYLRVLSSLVSWALENAVETSASMSARGYGLKGRSSFSLFRFTLADGAMTAISVALAGAVILLAGFGNAEFQFYPAIKAPAADLGTVGLYILFAVLSLMPFIIQLTEIIKWKYYESKI